MCFLLKSSFFRRNLKAAHWPCLVIKICKPADVSQGVCVRFSKTLSLDCYVTKNNSDAMIDALITDRQTN